MAEEAPLLNDEADHPHDVVFEQDGRRVIVMDSARYVDGRNTATDVVVPSSSREPSSATTGALAKTAPGSPGSGTWRPSASLRRLPTA
jgi:hypothetical protein